MFEGWDEFDSYSNREVNGTCFFAIFVFNVCIILLDIPYYSKWLINDKDSLFVFVLQDVIYVLLSNVGSISNLEFFFKRNPSMKYVRYKYVQQKLYDLQ